MKLAATDQKGQHHEWCRSNTALAGCRQCADLFGLYPFLDGETSDEATERYFPSAPAVVVPEPENQLVLVKPGRPVLVASEPMVQAHEKIQETLTELEIFMRQETVSLRRSRRVDEFERVEEVRTTKIKSFRRRTDYHVLETDGHKREVQKVKTTASKLEKDGRLSKDLSVYLHLFAQMVADGWGAATGDGQDSTNRLTAAYEPIGTLSGFGSKTPSDRQLWGMEAYHDMRQRIPQEFVSLFDQIVNEEVAGYSPLAKTLAELGEYLGYKHKQSSASGGTQVYCIVAMIAHFLKERGIYAGKLRQGDAREALIA